jgi:hypothetical protein
MSTAKIQPGQTVWDVALAKYGSIAAIGWLMQDNDYAGEFILGSVEQEEQTLKIREEVVDQSIVDYLAPRQNTTY